MSTNGRSQNGEPNVATSFAELTHDAIELAELQAKLFSLDIRTTSERARTSLVFAVVGVCVLLGTIPVALLTLGALFQQWGLSQAGGYGIATLIGLLLSAGILIGAWMRFKKGLVTLQRSREELSRNIAWVKSNLRSRSQASSKFPK